MTDYDNSKSLIEYMNNFKSELLIGTDFLNINKFLINNFNKNDMMFIEKKLFTPSTTSLYNKENLFEIFLQQILDCLCELRYIYNKINKTNVIINNKPFIINKISAVIAS